MGRSVAVLLMFLSSRAEVGRAVGFAFYCRWLLAVSRMKRWDVSCVSKASRGVGVFLFCFGRASIGLCRTQVVEKEEQRALLFFHFDGSPPAGFIKYPSDFVRRQKAHRALGDCAQESHAPPARERQCPSARPRKLQRTAKEIWFRRSLPFGNLFSWHAVVALKRQLCLFWLFLLHGRRRSRRGELSFFGDCMICGCRVLWRRQNNMCAKDALA